MLCLAVGAGLLAGLGVGCSPGSSGSRTTGPQAATNIVARVGDRFITLEALERELALRSAGRSSVEMRRRVLQEMVDREAMLLRARAEGFDREAQVQAQMDRFLASLWEQERLAENMEGQFAVTDAEIRAYYEAHAAEFLKPAAVRAGVIKFGVGDNTTVEQRQAVHARANAVRELAARADERGFRQLVQQHSEDQSTRYIGGDTGWIEDGQRTWRWDEAVVEVSRELNQPGEVSELVETGSAVYVVRLLDRRAATLVSLADVSESIRYQVAREHEARRQEAFRNSVREGLAIEVNEPLLESIPVLTNKPHPPAMPGG